MKRPIQPPSIDVDAIDDVCIEVAARSAVLEKLAIAHQTYQHRGTNERLDEAFWYGVEMLMRDNRRDLERLQKADEKGGR